VTGPHLGQAAVALADGQLRDGALDRALGHLAVCAPCLAEVAAHRAVKARLAALDAPPPPPGLAEWLRGLHPDGTQPAAPASSSGRSLGLPSRSVLAGALALAALGGGAALASRGPATLPVGGGPRVVDPAAFAVRQPTRPARGLVLDDPVLPAVAAVSVP